MSINTAANGPGRLLLMSGERVVSRNKSVEFALDGNNLPPKLLKKESGEVYLTDRRAIFLCSDSKNLHSFSADFRSLSNVNLEQPLFGANFVKAIVRSEPGGGWDGTAKMKLVFSAGGAIEFGKHLIHMQQGGGPPIELPPTYDSFDYNPYGPPPAPYNQGGGYYPPAAGAPPGPGYYPPPPPGYSAGPSGYTAPPTYVYDSGPAAGSDGPSSSAPPYNPSFPDNNAAASQVMYSGHTAYTNQQPGPSSGAHPPPLPPDYGRESKKDQ